MKKLVASITTIRPVVRRIVPKRLHHMVGQSVRALIQKVESPSPKISLQPLTLAGALPTQISRDGPIVFANTALQCGGVERQIANLISRVGSRTGRKPLLLCLRLGESGEFDFFLPLIQASGVEARNVMDFDEHSVQLKPRDFFNAMSGLADLPIDVRKDVARFAAEFVKLRPCVVHGWQDAVGVSAGLAAVLVGVPRVLIAGRNLAPFHFSYYRPYIGAAYARLAKDKSVILTNNSDAGALDYANWLNIDRGKIKIIRNGVTGNLTRLDKGAREDLRNKLTVPLDAPLIGSIFRFHSEKRPLLWIKAAASILAHRPDAHFVIFGDGPMLATARRQAALAGIAHRLCLPGVTNDVAKALSIIDVFMMTSAYEGTPNVALEAGLAGVPIVATKAGGTEETLDPGKTGYTAMNNGPDENIAFELASLVCQVLDDREWRVTAANLAPDFVLNKFSMERMVEDFISTYDLPPADPTHGYRVHSE